MNNCPKMMPLSLFLLIAAQSSLMADVTPSSLFGDHAVLQRDMPVPVWGSSEPGEKVTVRFAGKVVETQADAAGKWKVVLSAMTASSEGRELTIEGKNKLVLKDVLVGEVWLCSGQSNMQFGWGKESEPMYNWGIVPELAALVPEARKRPIRSFNVPTDVSLTPRDTCKGMWSTNVSGSAVAFGFSYFLQQKLDVPVAVIVTCWGSSSIEGWMPRDMTEQLPHFKTIMASFDGSTQIQNRVSAAIARGISHGNVFVRQQPNIVYNAMMQPVIPYASRGLVWYQGEANADKYADYAKSFPLWLARLRKEQGRDDFHLLGVMLPGFGSKSWPWFREVQMEILKVPHTSVANTIDLGDEKNIHPADKAPICERLALLARRDVYGEKIEAQGPAFKGVTVKGNQVVVEFTYAEGLKTLDGAAPTGFQLAGSNNTWLPAKAIIKGNTIELEADGLAEPKFVRYAFAPKPAVNLVNGANLPAYPFRTDEDPGVQPVAIGKKK
jgi:sialate O-acetylesterase